MAVLIDLRKNTECNLYEADELSSASFVFDLLPEWQRVLFFAGRS